MKRFRDLPIRRKIFVTVMAASGVAVLGTGITYAGFNIYNFYHDLDLRAQNMAQLLAVFSEAPLDFDDVTTAQTALERLAQHPYVLQAAILRQDGTVLAEHPSVEGTAGARRDWGLYTEGIAKVSNGDGDQLGEVRVKLRIQEQLLQFLQDAALLIVLVMLVAWGCALIVSGPLRRQITGPILDLSQIAQDVRDNHQLRGKVESSDEVGMLVANFNQMLDTLQLRERELLESERQFHSLVDNVPVGILRVRCDEKGTIVRSNPAMKEILGVRDRGEVPRDFRTYFVFDDDWDELLKEILELGQVLEREIPLKLNESFGVWVSITGSLLAGDTPDDRWIDCNVRDITQRKQTEAELQTYREHLEGLVATRTRELTARNEDLRKSALKLEQTNEELKTFAYIVSHDLRAPLVNLKGFVAELRLTASDLGRMLAEGSQHMPPELAEAVKELLDKDFRESLDFIDTSSTRMDRLLNSILQLSRLGRRELHIERVDTNELVDNIVKTLGHQLEQRHAKVIKDQLPYVYADRLSLDQIFGNLLDNAVKFLEDGEPGRIEIAGETFNGLARFTISDNGRGVDEKDMQKIFELFRRAGRQDRPGEGMGLPYVRTLVRRLGGEITCTSEIGRGTTFTFTLSSQLSQQDAALSYDS